MPDPKSPRGKLGADSLAALVEFAETEVTSTATVLVFSSRIKAEDVAKLEALLRTLGYRPSSLILALERHN